MMKIAVLAVALFSAGAARADDDTASYLYGAVGGVRTVPGIDKSATDAAVLAAGAPDVSSSVTNTDSGFKVQLGWMFSKYFAIEGGYLSLGTSAYNATFTGGTAKSDFKSGGVVLDIVGIVPIAGPISAFLKGGVIEATVITSFTMTGPGTATSQSHASDTRARPNFGVGALYDFTRSASLRVEFERFSKLGGGSTNGKSDVDMLSVGFVYKL